MKLTILNIYAFAIEILLKMETMSELQNTGNNRRIMIKMISFQIFSFSPLNFLFLNIYIYMTFTVKKTRAHYKLIVQFAII